MAKIWIGLFCFFMAAGTTLMGQAQLVTASFGKSELSEVIEEIESQSGIKIHHNKAWLEGLVYDGEFVGRPIGDCLRTVLRGKGLAFYSKSDLEIYLLETGRVSPDLADILKLNRTFSEEVSIGVITADIFEVEKFLLSGQITDLQSGDPVLGISVLNSVENIGAVSGAGGSFSIELPVGTNRLQISGVGFETQNVEMVISEDIERSFEMNEKSTVMNEIVISANAFDAAQNVQSSLEQISMNALRELPTFMGEVDVVKSISSFPGVSNVGEGAGGFNVRGGSTDENLILLDGIPIFNSSHLFGFFSVFNPDMIENFSLYKGAIPSEFGGRVSSVLDVQTSRGDDENLKINGSLGMLSTKINVSGPISSGKSTFNLGYRGAYPTWLFRYVPDKNIKESEATFQDFNARIDFDIKETHFTSSAYWSEDYFDLASDSAFNWSNKGASITADKNYGARHALRFQGAYSHYANNVIGQGENEEFELQTDLTYYGGKGVYSFFPDDNQVAEIGLEVTKYAVNTGKLIPREGSSKNTIETEIDQAGEVSLFGGYEVSLGDKITASTGIRVVSYANLGEATHLIYPEQIGSVDTVAYSKGKLYGGRMAVEPRLSAKWQIDNSRSIKIGFNRINQYLHRISNTAAVAPYDFWKLSDPNIEFTTVDQINAGYFQNYTLFNLATEVFYKRLDNALDYKPGADDLILNDAIDQELLKAEGRAYGLEFKLTKHGRLSGWVAYTLSRSERRVPGWFEEYYPSYIDRPNDISISATYTFSRRLSATINFVYADGRPLTVPIAAYTFNRNVIANYSERNQGRVPDYHRADIAIVLKENLKRNKLYGGQWVFSVYNIYSRRNPFSVYFSKTASGTLPKAYQMSVLGAAFPSLSYNFYLDPR